MAGTNSYVDSVFQQAVKAGGKTMHEPMDMFYGDHCGGVKDLAGNSWMIATRKEDFAPKEMAKRAETFFKQQPHMNDRKGRSLQPVDATQA